MDGQQDGANRGAREAIDASAQPAQQVKFTFKGNKPSALPTSDPDTLAALPSASASTLAPPDRDQSRNSEHDSTAPAHRPNSAGKATIAHDTPMADSGPRESGSDGGTSGNGSGEIRQVTRDSEDTGTTGQQGSVGEVTSIASKAVAARPDALAQPPASDSIQPDSPIVSSEMPSRAPSPTPREATPALSEAPSDTPSVDSSFAGPPPEASAFDLAHPLAAYQFANTTLVPVASTSTNPFHFVSWPPQPLEDSWQRTVLPGDDEVNLVHDPEPGYRATPEEIEASRVRQAEKQAKIKARLAAQVKGKGKAKEPAPKPPPRARAMERLASAEAPAAPAPTKRATKKSALQQEVQREPSPERPQPLVTKTRFARDLAMALVPDDVPWSMPAGVPTHRDFIDLLAMPPHFITEEGVPPTPKVSKRQQGVATNASHPSAFAPVSESAPSDPPPPTKAQVQAQGPAPQSGKTTPAPASTPAPVAQPASESVAEVNGTKRVRETTDEGTGAPKKKAREDEEVDELEPSPAPEAVATGGPVVDWNLQTTTCLSKKIDGQLRCFQCVARAIGHGCCFLGVRSFGIDAAGTIVTPPAFLDTKMPDDIPRFTKPLISPLSDQYNQLMRTWLAGALLPIVKAEQKHAQDPATKRERLDLSVLSICDTCNCSILGSEWMCSTCGRVACRTCYETLVAIEQQEQQKVKIEFTSFDVQRRKKCMAKKRGDNKVVGVVEGETHVAEQFVPMSRLDKKDLAQLHADLWKWNVTHAIVPSNGTAKKFLDTTYLTESPLPTYDVNTHPVHHIPAADMNAAVFLELWNYSIPVLITDIDLAGLKKWTPSYISNRFPNLEIQLHNNKGSEILTAKVPYFFSQFNEDGGPQRSAEVKRTFRTRDFPTARQFTKEFKELADEFYRVMPIRDILHPDGPLNYLAHTPANAVQPDVGPRGTNSWAVDAATGTTLLRTDMTDIANLMYWGHHDEATGRELRIRWDVFKAEDVDKLRDFCWEEVLTKRLPRGTSAAKFRETHDDPLLSPCLYLNQRQRELLAQTKGVSSFPIYQYPGQLVLIPAGCPYQVSSWSDHLSLTTQFLAGPRLPYAIKVNEACRLETKERALWRLDNIQLERQLLYTWYSCQHADKKYVPCPLDWKPNGGRTAEDLARETAQAEAAEAAAAEAKEAAEKAATAGQAATAPAT